MHSALAGGQLSREPLDQVNLYRRAAKDPETGTCHSKLIATVVCQLLPAGGFYL